jgi:hypothetical protein
LDPVQPRSEIEDQVVGLAIQEWLEGTYSELCGQVRDRELGGRALPVGREHVEKLVGLLDNTNPAR